MVVRKFSGYNKLHSCKVLTVAPSLPKYSEVWMKRMNDLFQQDSFFVAISSASEHNSIIKNVSEVSLSPVTKLPNKIHMLIFGTSIRKQLIQILKEIPKDAVILCHYLTTAVYLWDVLKDCQRKVFIHCHGHDVTWDRRVEKLPMIPAHGFMYKSKVKKIIDKGTFIANSNCTRGKLVSIGIPDKDIFVNYLSVNVSEIKPVIKNSVEELKVLYLGRLTDCKGPIETIKAFELACFKGFNGVLDIVGGGSLLGKCLKIRESSKYKESIHIHGPANREQAIKFFSEAHIFSAHNKFSTKTRQEEAFGVSIIEAMAFGIPVVTGASGGVIETVVHGETGILISPGNIEEHADALLSLANNSTTRESMGVEGRARVEKLFNSRTAKLKLENIFKYIEE